MDLSYSHRSSQTVGGYEIGGVIGIGTYGEVRAAKDVSTGRRAAIKIVDLSRFEMDTQMIMVKEIDILKSIDHVNCIRILDVKDKVPYRGTWCSVCACSEFQPMLGSHECMSCSHEGSDHSSPQNRQVMLLVQELAVGGELCGLLMHSGPFPEDIARYYFRQLLEGLEYCHSRGVVHRDLKPENLVLDGNFQLKIVDFGLAAHVHEEMGGVLHTGVGSAPYSAPEVYYSKDIYGGQAYRGEPADLWSCAVILFVMLTARPPFLRPLNETYGPSLKRDKYFVNLLRGQGYDKMSIQAKSMLSKIFQLNPRDRISIAQLKEEEWMRGPVPSSPELCRVMEEKAQAVWITQQKPQMVELLAKHRQELVFTPTFAPNAAPVAGGVFADADTNISLLSLHESESDVVYRSLSIAQADEDSNVSSFSSGAYYSKQGIYCELPTRAPDDDMIRSKARSTSSFHHSELDAKDSLKDLAVPHLSPSLYGHSSFRKKRATSDESDSDGSCGDFLSFTGPRTENGISTIRLPFTVPSDSRVNRYSRLISPLSQSEVRARVSHSLKSLGIKSSPSHSFAISVSGTVHGFSISGLLYISELEVSVAAGASARDHITVLDCQKLRGDPLAFHHMFSSLAQSLAH